MSEESSTDAASQATQNETQRNILRESLKHGEERSSGKDVCNEDGTGTSNTYA